MSIILAILQHVRERMVPPNDYTTIWQLVQFFKLPSLLTANRLGTLHTPSSLQQVMLSIFKLAGVPFFWLIAALTFDLW